MTYQPWDHKKEEGKDSEDQQLIAVLLEFSGPEYPPIESLEIKTGSVLHIAIS